MKINENLWIFLIEDSILDGDHFFLINFHPKGEPEAFICCVIKGLQ